MFEVQSSCILLERAPPVSVFLPVLNRSTGSPTRFLVVLLVGCVARSFCLGRLAPLLARFVTSAAAASSSLPFPPGPFPRSPIIVNPPSIRRSLGPRTRSSSARLSIRLVVGLCFGGCFGG